MYDDKKHILLCDEAHRRRIDPLANDGEFKDFIQNVIEYPYDPQDSSARMVPFEVELPEWPPIERTPLALIFGGDGGPFKDIPWVGKKLVVDRNFWTRRALGNVARSMVPVAQNYDPQRMSYMWQCEIFNPKIHSVVRTWCEANGIDIVHFWKDFYPKSKEWLTIIETTNPNINKERAVGSFSPTRRSFLLQDIERIKKELLGATQIKLNPKPKVLPRNEARELSPPFNLSAFSNSPTESILKWKPPRNFDPKSYQILFRHVEFDLPGEFSVIIDDTGSTDKECKVTGLQPGTKYVFRVKAHTFDGRLSPRSNFAKLHTLEDSSTTKPLEIPAEVTSSSKQTGEEPIPIWEGVKIYSPSQVTQALRERLGRDIRLFGGQTSDSKIVALRNQAVYDFLREDKTDENKYVWDRGERNFDCDNFADALRSNLNRKYGLNSVGIIWGDAHAWNFIVACGDIENSLDTGPKIIMVEPQDDHIVSNLTGAYSIDRRCEVYL